MRKNAEIKARNCFSARQNLPIFWNKSQPCCFKFQINCEICGMSVLSRSVSFSNFGFSNTCDKTFDRLSKHPITVNVWIYLFRNWLMVFIFVSSWEKQQSSTKWNIFAPTHFAPSVKVYARAQSKKNKSVPAFLLQYFESELNWTELSSSMDMKWLLCRH